MDNRLQDLVDLTRQTFDLKYFHLKRYSFRRHVNIFKETNYSLLMEWFPNNAIQPDDLELNPKGTAVISVDMESKLFNQIIFVGRETLVNNQLFAHASKSDVIEWIESKTGYFYEKDFILSHESRGKYEFIACIDGIKVSPSGLIKLEYDILGNLVLFTIEGQFARRDYVGEKASELTLDQVEHIAMDHLKLVEIPSEILERQISVYGLEEIYVKKEELLVVPFKNYDSVREHYQINKLIYWNSPLKEKFQEVDIQLTEELSIEQALAKETSPDSYPITSIQKTECIYAIKDFLRQEYPNDSGKWLLQTLNRNYGFIIAKLVEKETTNELIARKITVLIDSQSIQAVNYVDNKSLLDLMPKYKNTFDKTVTKKLAYEIIKEYMTLEPYYVYNFDLKRYTFCMKLDCDYAVNANNGRVSLLDDVK